MDNTHHTIIKIEGLKKDYVLDGDRKAPVLLGIDLEINARDFTIIYGPSGCGKSTLLHTIIGLETPTSGRVVIRETDIYKLKEEDRSVFLAHSSFAKPSAITLWSESVRINHGSAPAPHFIRILSWFSFNENNG